MKSKTFSAFFGFILAISTSLAGTIEYTNHDTFASDAGNLTIVGFDGFAHGALLASNQFSEFTIVARRIQIVEPVDFGATPLNVNSQPYGISASFSTNNFDNGDDNFDFLMTTPARAVGIWLGQLGANLGDGTDTIVTVFSTNGEIIASEGLDQFHMGIIKDGLNNRIFYGVISDKPITKLQIREPRDDADGIVLDDFQFSQQDPRTDLRATIQISCVDVLWAGLTNRSYQVQYSSELTTNTWFNIGLPIQGNGTNAITDCIHGIEHRFYRIIDTQ
jgi:hypothetical protein